MVTLCIYYFGWRYRVIISYGLTCKVLMVSKSWNSALKIIRYSRNTLVQQISGDLDKQHKHMVPCEHNGFWLFWNGDIMHLLFWMTIWRHQFICPWYGWFIMCMGTLWKLEDFYPNFNHGWQYFTSWWQEKNRDLANGWTHH